MNLQPCIRQYTSSNEEFEYGYPLNDQLNVNKYFFIVLLTNFMSILQTWNVRVIQGRICFLFVCFVALCPKSTDMVIAGRSVHLTTLFPGQA